MKIKWWRWWIVPLILTILFEVGLAILDMNISSPGLWPRVFNSQFGENLILLLMGGFFAFIPFIQNYAAVLTWPLFLGLVWPAALIIHVVWKRRKAKKQGVLTFRGPEVQPGPKDAL
jgi:hypothetical protein